MVTGRSRRTSRKPSCVELTLHVEVGWELGEKGGGGVQGGKERMAIRYSPCASCFIFGVSLSLIGSLILPLLLLDRWNARDVQ